MFPTDKSIQIRKLVNDPREAIPYAGEHASKTTIGYDVCWVIDGI